MIRPRLDMRPVSEQLGYDRIELCLLQGAELGMSDFAVARDNDREGQRHQFVPQRVRELHGLHAADERRVVKVDLLRELLYFVYIIDGDADKLHTFVAGRSLGPDEIAHLVPARHTPSGPEIHHQYLAPPLIEPLGTTFDVRK